MTEDLYRKGDSVSHNDAWERQRSFLWGFSQAGKVINLVSTEDIQRTIDRAHERVFGESRESRIERLNPIADKDNIPDWDEFDPPTYERIKEKSGS